MVNLVICEILKLKRTFILWVGILVMSVIPILTLFMDMGKETTFLDFAKSSLLLSILLSFPCLYTLIGTFIFNREYQEDTMKMLLCIPIPRIKIVVSKIFVLILFFLVALTYHTFVTIILALMLNCTGVNISNMLTILSCNLLVVLPYTVVMLPLIGFIVFSRKGYILPLSISIAITISNMIIAQSKFAAFYPWTAVVRFCGDIQGVINFNFQYPVVLSIIALGICALLGIAMLSFSALQQEN